VLGQVLTTGTANSLTAYTAATSGGTIVSTIAVANDTAATLTARVRVVPAGATEGAVHTLVPTGTSVLPGDLLTFTLGVSLANGDAVKVAGDAGLAVHVYGTEF
jgi:hypothetical protein